MTGAWSKILSLLGLAWLSVLLVRQNRRLLTPIRQTLEDPETYETPETKTTCTSTFNATTPSSWGICDPQTVNSTYCWPNRVFVVSFAGWNDQRKAKMQRLRSLPHVQTLLYTEDDLPQEYYDTFAWAFEKPEYRGFWTWKPWILRNLTQHYFQTGDLVLWLDSDELFRRTDTDDSLHPYVQTLLCNMEHRNRDNFGGIYPFERCFGHAEYKYTKPSVLEQFNATAYAANKEQIYAGMLGFQVGPDTLSFLQEWQDYGKDPVLFGNDADFPSPTDLPAGYKQHKNDQSIFSLLVRRHNMTTWAPPYFWAGDSGVQQCLPLYQRSGYCFVLERETNDVACRPFEQWLQEVPSMTTEYIVESTGETVSV